MSFRSVHLPEDRQLNGRVSQTMLAKYDRCPRNAFLYALYKGEGQTVEMVRGRAFHMIVERAVKAAVEHGEVTIPADIVKVIADEVLASEHVPISEHDRLREMSFRWASETALDPSAVIACETFFAWEVGGYQVRARIDYAELIEDGAAVVVRDWKSSRAAPPFEEVSRKRPDGSFAARHFQLVLYALMLAFGVPVRVEEWECHICHGRGWHTGGPGNDGPEAIRVPCSLCNETGARRSEIPEPFPVAARAQRFELEFVYPGIEDREGKMLRRQLTLTRLELEEYRTSLEGLLTRLAHSEESGDWPAVVSDAACTECPASSECPIPAELRDHRGVMNTSEQVAEALEKRYVEKAVNGAIQKEIRAFVKAHGPVPFGAGMVAEIGHTSSERIADKDAMFEAQERAVRYGEPFERHKFVKTVDSFPLVERALSADELAEIGGSNGSDGDEGGRGLDERFGADPPF